MSKNKLTYIQRNFTNTFYLIIRKKVKRDKKIEKMLSGTSRMYILLIAGVFFEYFDTRQVLNRIENLI